MNEILSVYEIAQTACGLRVRESHEALRELVRDLLAARGNYTLIERPSVEDFLAKGKECDRTVLDRARKAIRGLSPISSAQVKDGHHA